jgi:hypothetical protein
MPRILHEWGRLNHERPDAAWPQACRRRGPGRLVGLHGRGIRTRGAGCRSAGKVETLVFGTRFDNRDAVDAHWQGLYARIANTFPAELAGVVKTARLPQLNPQAGECDFVDQE